MYCYEFVFAVSSGKKITNHHENIVVHDSLHAVEYAKERLSFFPDDEIVAIVRREPIIKIMDARPDIELQTTALNTRSTKRRNVSVVKK